MDNIYQGNFGSWEDVINEFDAEAPEPDAVYIASYGGGGYDGDALVCFRYGEKYYTVEGGHCSCHGLEEQWSPEEYDRETFLQVLDRKIESNSRNSDYPTMDKTTWELVKKRVLQEQS